MEDAELWELIDDYVDEQVILERIDEEGEPWDEVMDDRLDDVCLGHPAGRQLAPVWAWRRGAWLRLGRPPLG